MIMAMGGLRRRPYQPRNWKASGVWCWRNTNQRTGNPAPAPGSAAPRVGPQTAGQPIIGWADDPRHHA
jgi:hypothetical protein